MMKHLEAIIFFAVMFMMPDASRADMSDEVFHSRILRVALEQVKDPSGYWDRNQRDCAGFIRFVLRTAAGLHSRVWKDSTGHLSDFVSARDLVLFNLTRVAIEPDSGRLQDGDILVFFAENKKPQDRWHLMMTLKSPYGSPDKTLVIYHNGAKGPDAQIRKVWLSDLMNHAGDEWQPKVSNARFKGVYRWQRWSKK